MSSDSSSSDSERGPNGFAYLDLSRSTVSRWETGEFHLKLWNQKGELMPLNLTEEQRDALVAALQEADRHD